MVLLVIGDGSERARLEAAARRDRRRIVGPLSRPSRRCARAAGGVRSLREQLDQRRHLADDSRGDGGRPAGRRDARRRHAGDRRRHAAGGWCRRAIRRRSPAALAALRQRRGAPPDARPRRARAAWSSTSRSTGWCASTATPTTRRRPDMCGICGVFALNGPLDPEVRAALPAMNGALAHRGPDGDGFFDDTRVALGHRRLAIIDRAGGHQPMANEDGTCWIVFNGEIYNHRVAAAAARGQGPSLPHVVRHRRRSSTPTRSSGPPASSGSKACSRSRSTTAAGRSCSPRAIASARSRSSTPCSTACFTSPASCRRSRTAARGSGDVDLTALEGYLSLGYFLAPATIYRDVFKLLPGHWLRVADGRVETRQYWDVQEFDTDDRPDDELIDEIDATLRQAVHDRLESEVPLGAFLSGGIDSGLVVSYMAEALGDRLVTASVGFGEPRTTSSRPRASTADALPQPALRASHRAGAGRGDRPGDDATSASRSPIRRRFRRGTSRARRGGT